MNFMAVRGSVLKNEIIKKIIQTFPNSFLYNDGKEVRINGEEDGIPIQIKLTLTASKTPVDNEDGVITVTSIGETPIKAEFEGGTEVRTFVPNEKIPDEPTEEEKARLKTLLEGLGL